MDKICTAEESCKTVLLKEYEISRALLSDVGTVFKRKMAVS